ncbi:hypothetical protein WN51_08117 [Melipona quadrifasciata]|uniref:Uncharacterized protein n=1 Tax=Melipona quadrifasciata TaxID=166423 RepID=A0A0N0U2P7_9HYME|nr:hypothetical protein WN51_08117 [Melipona quadrifasciata]
MTNKNNRQQLFLLPDKQQMYILGVIIRKLWKRAGPSCWLDSSAPQKGVQRLFRLTLNQTLVKPNIDRRTRAQNHKVATYFCQIEGVEFICDSHGQTFSSILYVFRLGLAISWLKTGLNMRHPIQMKPADSENRNEKKNLLETKPHEDIPGAVPRYFCIFSSNLRQSQHMTKRTKGRNVDEITTTNTDCYRLKLLQT